MSLRDLSYAELDIPNSHSHDKGRRNLRDPTPRAICSHYSRTCVLLQSYQSKYQTDYTIEDLHSAHWRKGGRKRKGAKEE